MNERQKDKLANKYINKIIKIDPKGIKQGKIIKNEHVEPAKPDELLEALLYENQILQQQNKLLSKELEEQKKYGRKITLTGDECVQNVINILKKDYISKGEIQKILDKYRHITASEESAVDMYQDILATTK